MKKSSLINSRMERYAFVDKDKMLKELNTSLQGLKTDEVEEINESSGKKQFQNRKDDTVLFRLRRSFVNPFTVILFVLALVSFFTDTMLTTSIGHNKSTVYIILVMIIISGLLRFTQEIKAKKTSENLRRIISLNAKVIRDGVLKELPSEQLVVGDYIYIAAGERVPADVRFIETTDLFISQAAITGESSILEKSSDTLIEKENYNLSEYSNLAFMGTTVISGQGKAIVLGTGNETLYGSFSFNKFSKYNSYEKGANSIAWILIKFMVTLVSMIFIIMGITKGDWVESFLFALSVAVGLTPEMLPMVVTTCLAKGSISMSKKQTIVKNINSMQVLGAMDVLCIDKTGTITNDSILLEYYMDVLGNENEKVLDMAYLNSLYHSGTKNHIDEAILKCKSMANKKNHFSSIPDNWIKVDEIPFDYNRKCVSVLVEDSNEKRLLITKGSVEELFQKCKYINYNNEIIEINKSNKNSMIEVVGEMLEDGMKVIGIAIKNISSDRSNIYIDDEEELILIGYVAFFDAPKKSAFQAIEKLNKLKVKTKILSGDNKKVTTSICKRVGINTDKVITGKELEKLSREELDIISEEAHVFVELTPSQKAEIINILRENGHTVGFMGDGINDIPAISEADVGISVDSAVEAAEEVADIVLLKKDLNVLEEGILEGRKTFSNISKYIYITASSNFGNIFAIVCASIFLPFLPMTALQLIMLNLLYDTICIVLPWDNVDEEIYSKPREWSGRHLSRFMLFFGPISSFFDIITYLFLYFVLCPLMCGGLLFTAITDPVIQRQYISIFQTGWFLESMWTQVLIIYMLRTKKLPLINSSPSKVVISVTIIGVSLFTVFSFLPIAGMIGLTSLPKVYFVFLIIVVPLYMTLTTIAKYIYTKKYSDLF